MRAELIISPAKDEGYKYSYDQRFLDNLACIFNFQDPCAAMTFLPSKNEFLLSYNRECVASTKSKIDEVHILMKEGSS